MSTGSILPRLSADQVESWVKSVSSGDFVAVTLTNGDTLLGGILQPPWADNTRVSVSFNTHEGRRYGHSHLVEVPAELVADLSVVPLDEETIPKPGADDPDLNLLQEIVGEDALGQWDLRVPPRGYPNPLASAICEHNLRVAASLGLEVWGYAEKALAGDAVPPEGIRFKGDTLLYADWEFFAQYRAGGGSVSAGIPGIFEVTKDLSQSPQAQVLQRLKAPIHEKVRRAIAPVANEHRVEGRILWPQDAETTTLEGAECLLVGAEDSRTGQVRPVLLKKKYLKYPQELLPLVRSMLTFYGELVQIPVIVFGQAHQETLLARAFGYVPGKRAS
jgi:hypothetical protein